MVYFVTAWEMHGFPHQNPLCDLPSYFSKVLFFLLVPKSIDSFKEKTEKTDKVFKAKYIKRRRGNGCNFIKNKEYKYALSKSMPLYTNLSLFLIISSKNCISPQKNFNEKCSNRGICQESVPGI